VQTGNGDKAKIGLLNKGAAANNALLFNVVSFG